MREDELSRISEIDAKRGEVGPFHLQMAPVLHGQHIQLIHHKDLDRRKEVPVSSTNESKYPAFGRIPKGPLTFPSQ